MRARTAAVNELKALVVTADDELRRELRGLRTPKLVACCTKFRDTPDRAIDQRCTRAARNALARRIEHLDHEVDDHYRVLKQPTATAKPWPTSSTPSHAPRPQPTPAPETRHDRCRRAACQRPVWPTPAQRRRIARALHDATPSSIASWGAAPLRDWNPEPGHTRTTADPLEDAHRQTPLRPTWAAAAPRASLGYCRIRFQCSSGAATPCSWCRNS